ncbi:hypothetical protein CJU90_2465 [Yarrowia sp. C11]|nr:hypothetical protein CKK34_3913 [Yarrowia sp. E02]KAG5369023.1 hypothetical protein CJU90_2465 [Yarrowia sp. C11]
MSEDQKGIDTAAMFVDPMTGHLPSTTDTPGFLARPKGDINPQTKANRMIPLHVLWFFSHQAIVGTGACYFALFFMGISNCKLARGLYRLFFVACISAYYTSIYRKYGGQRPSRWVLLQTDTFQYLLMAVLFLISRRSIFKLFPFFMYSVMHVAETLRRRVLKRDSPLAHQLNENILKFEAPIQRIVADSEILILLKILLNTIMFRQGAAICLLLYVVIFRLRVSYSPPIQESLKRQEERIDDVVSQSWVPAAVKQHWGRFRDLVDNYEHSRLTSLNEDTDDDLVEVYSDEEGYDQNEDPDDIRNVPKRKVVKRRADLNDHDRKKK